MLTNPDPTPFLHIHRCVWVVFEVMLTSISFVGQSERPQDEAERGICFCSFSGREKLVDMYRGRARNGIMKELTA